jgi:hypothetical protein
LIIIRNVAFALALLAAVSFLVSLFVCRRADVSLLKFFAAGPRTVLRPSNYLRADRYKVPPALFVLTMLLFLVVWFASWMVNNP